MDTDKLIQDLAKEGQPVKRLRSPHVRFAFWLTISAIYIVIGLFVAGLRGDCAAKLCCAGFMWQTCCILGLGILAAYLAFVMSVPGRKPGAALRWSVILLAAATLTTLVLLTCTTPGCTAGAGLSCSLKVTAFGVIPAFILIGMLTRAAPLKCVLCGILIGIVALALGAAAMQFVCGSDDPLHLLLWHYLPGILFVIIGIMIANRLFRL